jgi:hypothetical protein
VFIHFLAPHGKLYFRLQAMVPEGESFSLAASAFPMTMASSIARPHALLHAADGATGSFT